MRQELIFAKGEELWAIEYAGGKSYTTRQGTGGKLGKPAETKLATKAAAKAAGNREIDRRLQLGFIGIDPRRLRSNVPGARWAALATVKPLLARAKAPKAWHKRLAHARYLLEEGVLLHEGDLRVDKLAVGPNPLVVTGNLVANRLTDGHKADETALVVLGNLVVKDCATFASMCIAGDATIRGVLYGFSAHDHVLAVGRRLIAKTLIDGDHWFEAFGGAKVGLLVGKKGCLLGKAKATRTAAPHEVLERGAWTWLEAGLSGVEHYRVASWMIAGKPVLA